MDLSDTIKILQASHFFSGMPLDDIEKVADLCRTAEYKPGDFVFEQGNYGECLYIIIEGKVFLERAMHTGTHKGRVLIETLGKGRTLGCWSTLLGEKHKLMSSASCQSPSTLLVIPGHALRQMMLAKSHFGFNLMERLCFLLRDRIQAAYGALDKI